MLKFVVEVSEFDTDVQHPITSFIGPFYTRDDADEWLGTYTADVIDDPEHASERAEIGAPDPVARVAIFVPGVMHPDDPDN